MTYIRTQLLPLTEGEEDRHDEDKRVVGAALCPRCGKRALVLNALGKLGSPEFHFYEPHHTDVTEQVRCSGSNEFL